MDIPHGLTIDYLVALALEAGKIMKQNYGLGMERQWKADESPVTVTDKTINQLVIDRIKRDFPQVHVRGEEGSGEASRSPLLILTDPVDGTVAFSTGIPAFTFVISLVNDGVPILACIYDPMQDRVYTATKGGGAYLNNTPIHVSTRREIKRSFVNVVMWKGCGYEMVPVLSNLIEKGANTMVPLSIAYWAALVAAGELDATIFPSPYAWETAAIKLLVEEAGGKVTDLYGEDQRYDGTIRGHIASNGYLHA